MPALLLILLAQAQEPVPPTPEAPFRPRVTVSGRIDGYYVHRSGASEEAAGNLNSAAASTPDTDFFSGRLTARIDAQLRPTIKAVLELENQPYAAGSNNPFGENDAEVFFEQAFVEITEFLTPKLTFRAGVQDVRLALRPHADAFFLDVSESEAFYSGSVSSPTGGFVRATADRDLSESAGIKLIYDAEEFLLFQGYAGVVRESGAPSDDETLAYAYGNLWIPETVSAFLLVALVAGPGKEAQVLTFGFGADGYLKPWLEAFGEVYVQAGSIDPNTDKLAYGFQIGSRVWAMQWFFEGAFAWRSGDDDPTDGDDAAFQSYESEGRLLIAENAEVGLDWDTNVRAIRLTVGLQNADLGGVFKDVTFRLDAGLLRFNEDLRSATGAVLVPSSDDVIGNEVDVSAEWIYEETVSFFLRAGVLVGSDVLEALTASRDDNAAAFMIGGRVRF